MIISFFKIIRKLAGADAMRSAPTPGLAAFCQKFFLREDDEETVHLSFNDLVAMADRQNVDKNIALRIINFRLKNTFNDLSKCK